MKSSVRVRVLFDSGSHRSFGTTKAVHAAGEPVKRKQWIKIRSFGQEKAEGKLREVLELELLPVETGESVKLELYALKSISRIKNEHGVEEKRLSPFARFVVFGRLQGKGGFGNYRLGQIIFGVFRKAEQCEGNLTSLSQYTRS